MVVNIDEVSFKRKVKDICLMKYVIFFIHLKQKIMKEIIFSGMFIQSFNIIGIQPIHVVIKDVILFDIF